MTSRQEQCPKKVYNLLIGVTGSVATIKLIELIKSFKLSLQEIQSDPEKRHFDVNIRVLMTNCSKHFVQKEELTKIKVEVYDDDDEWSSWKHVGSPVLHIELRRWADVLLIAPLDANTMAKICNGICDNLLTCVVRAWDVSKPLVYCPAMNVNMYNHPLTEQHLSKLESFGYLRVDAIEKNLACGDFGIGGMATIGSIVDFVMRKMEIVNN